MTRQRHPLKRSPLPARTSAPPRKRAKPRKVLVLRDRGYLDWLHDRNCVACERTRRDLAVMGFTREAGYTLTPLSTVVDPAHGPVNGGSSKGPDNEAIPLCRHHHIEQHQIGWNLFEAKYGFSRAAEAKAHYAAYLLTRS